MAVLDYMGRVLSYRPYWGSFVNKHRQIASIPTNLHICMYMCISLSYKKLICTTTYTDTYMRMYVYVCVHICIYVCICMYMYVYVCICMYGYVYVHMYMYTCTFTGKYTCIWICACMLAFICMCICTCRCRCMIKVGPPPRDSQMVSSIRGLSYNSNYGFWSVLMPLMGGALP